MYQCFVSNEWEQIQSTSELQLGGNFFFLFIVTKIYMKGLGLGGGWLCSTHVDRSEEAEKGVHIYFY